MWDAIDSLGGGMNAGAMSALVDKNRERQATDRAQAVQQGGRVNRPEEIESKVREVAEDFVSVFMNQVMKSMRSTVQENPTMHGDNGEKFFQELLDAEYSKSAAKGSGYGLTDLVYQSLIASYRVNENQTVAATQAGEVANEAVEAATTDDMRVNSIE